MRGNAARGEWRSVGESEVWGEGNRSDGALSVPDVGGADEEQEEGNIYGSFET